MPSPERGALVVFAIIIAVSVLAIVIAIAAAVVQRRTPADERAGSDVDPLFITGITLIATSVALVIMLGPLMYGMMAIGFIVMAIGAGRMRRERSQRRG